jgi:DNA invertase Pin-like site-specific DNA recombinase
MMTNTIIYARASAEFPVSLEGQVECLKAIAALNGWTVARVFIERLMPPKRGREQRPAELAMLATIQSRSVDKVLVWSLDRVGRTLAELVGLLEACRAAGTGVYIHDRQLYTAIRNGLSLFDVASMMACHLRQSRRVRILRGQIAARNANVRFGRPPIAGTKIETATAFLMTGKGVRETARLVGISAASVSRLKAATAAAAVT